MKGLKKRLSGSLCKTDERCPFGRSSPAVTSSSEGCCGNPVAVVTLTPVTEPGPPEDRGRVSDGVASLPLI